MEAEQPRQEATIGSLLDAPSKSRKPPSTFETFLDEVAKCVVLCITCHRKRHGPAAKVRAPLSLPVDHWRSRWLVFPTTWDRLHRVSEIEWEDGNMIGGFGIALCGRKGYLTMPGIGSRMGLPRCAHCCRLTGVPRGDGAPFNSQEEWTVR